LSPFSTAFVRPEFPSNDRRPPARRVLAADVVGYYSRLMGANETRRANAVCERAGIHADVAEDDRRIKTTGGPHRLRKQRRVNAPANRVIFAFVVIGATK
jgi:hypothetical protein